MMSFHLSKLLSLVACLRGLLQIALVACAWVFFFYLTTFLFAYAEFNHEAFWVFLPAGVRLMAVMLLGWLGVVGIFVGSALTNDSANLNLVLLVSLTSAIAPKLGLITGRRLMSLPKSLHSLNPIRLMVLALLASFFNAFLTVGLFQLLGKPQHVFNLIPMFVGDMVGTLIIFYLTLLLWYLAKRFYAFRFEIKGL